MESNQWLEKIPIQIGWYIAGFTDGEGSFNVSIKKVIDHTLGWKLTLSYNVSQKDPTMLYQLKKHFGTGTIRFRKDGIGYFEVTSIPMLKQRVIPFFKKFQFLSVSKKHNFAVFEKILNEIIAGRHLTKDGFKYLLLLREQLNVGHGRKRKYNLSDIIIPTK